MKPQSLKISKIRCDAGTQSRTAAIEETVAEYAERMLEGDKFPPVDVFFDGNEYYLADGFHRVLAAARNRLLDILAIVHKGTALDALWFALGSNKTNGMRRSAGDKRNAIELALVKFPDKTQEAIAAHVGCAQSYVNKVKNELITSDKFAPPTKRMGKDGKIRKTKYQQREKEPEPEIESEEEESGQQPPALPVEPNEDEPFAEEKPRASTKLEQKRSEIESSLRKWESQWAACDLPLIREIYLDRAK